jgi:signal transduction histidine kinase
MSTSAKFASMPRGSGRELCSLFEYAPIGLAQCDFKGSIVAWNPVLKKMVEGMSEDVRPSFISDLIHPHERVEFAGLFRELFEQRRDSFRLASKNISAESRPVRWTAWWVQGADREPDHAMVLAEDTDQNHDQVCDVPSRLYQAERLEAVGRLASGVAHDFNNLLTGILLYCDLLIANLAPSGRVRKYAEEIRAAGVQASGLVRQLLTVARPANSKPQLLSFNEIAEGLRNLLVRLIGEDIDLQFHLDPNLGLVQMDPAQSQQILLNLVLNARDAMPDGGQIKLETSNCKVQVLAETNLRASRPTSLPCALVVVTDNGSGMDAATHAHLFEAFFTTKASQGTGLGLATVHEIVTRSGGLIHVDSTPACGTRVSILLPLVRHAALDSQVADFSTEPPREVTTVEGQKKD